MMAQLDAFRDQLSQFVMLIDNMIAEGEKMPSQPESLGFLDQARAIFYRNLKEMDQGLSTKDADAVIHSVVVTHSDLRQLTECDLTWSSLWRQSDARERMRETTANLIKGERIIDRRGEISKQMNAGL